MLRPLLGITWCCSKFAQQESVSPLPSPWPAEHTSSSLTLRPSDAFHLEGMLLSAPRQTVKEKGSLASPAFATWLTGTPSSWDMYPKTEKMANPARMLVMALPRVTMKVSL